MASSTTFCQKFSATRYRNIEFKICAVISESKFLLFDFRFHRTSGKKRRTFFLIFGQIFRITRVMSFTPDKCSTIGNRMSTPFSFRLLETNHSIVFSDSSKWTHILGKIDPNRIIFPTFDIKCFLKKIEKWWDLDLFTTERHVV